jgi:hypothetical protein
LNIQVEGAGALSIGQLAVKLKRDKRATKCYGSSDLNAALVTFFCSLEAITGFFTTLYTHK